MMLFINGNFKILLGPELIICYFYAYCLLYSKKYFLVQSDKDIPLKFCSRIFICNSHFYYVCNSSQVTVCVQYDLAQVFFLINI